jgi:hypothetical protein
MLRLKSKQRGGGDVLYDQEPDENLYKKTYDTFVKNIQQKTKRINFMYFLNGIQQSNFQEVFTKLFKTVLKDPKPFNLTTKQIYQIHFLLLLLQKAREHYFNSFVNKNLKERQYLSNYQKYLDNKELSKYEKLDNLNKLNIQSFNVTCSTIENPFDFQTMFNKILNPNFKKQYVKCFINLITNHNDKMSDKQKDQLTILTNTLDDFNYKDSQSITQDEKGILCFSKNENDDACEMN